VDWGTLAVALIGAVLGGVGGTWIAGRQARNQARLNAATDLARGEAVEFLAACDRIWTGRLDTQEVHRDYLNYLIPGRAVREFRRLTNQDATGIEAATRAAAAIAILTDDVQPVCNRLLDAALVELAFHKPPTDEQVEQYRNARQDFIKRMKAVVLGDK